MVISTGGGIIEISKCKDILNSLKNNVVFIDRDYDELMEANHAGKPLYNGKTIEEVYKSRLPLYKNCSVRFSPPSYSLMSSLFKTKEEYLERLKDMFVKLIYKKWISSSTMKVPFPPSDSFFACTDMDLR